MEKAMSERPGREHDTPPFDWGDRVDHPKFGLGTIVSRPGSVSGPIAEHRDVGGYRVGPKGWTIEVEWDDPNRPRGKFSSSHFRLVERPDAKGGAYWAAIYQEKLENALDTRRRTDVDMQRAFRSSEGGAADVRMKLKAEREAIDDLLMFLEADDAGEHP
jgi:hypothetical protein